MDEAKVIEGSQAVARAVKLCRPDVISAYPISPQTHIVENLAQMAADGELKSEMILVESEFSAASAVTGASAAGPIRLIVYGFSCGRPDLHQSTGTS